MRRSILLLVEPLSIHPRCHPFLVTKAKQGTHPPPIIEQKNRRFSLSHLELAGRRVSHAGQEQAPVLQPSVTDSGDDVLVVLLTRLCAYKECTLLRAQQLSRRLHNTANAIG